MTLYEADSGFLLRITLTKTSNPVVTRAIAIPADLTFEELHDTITAAFNWNDRDDPCTTWIFRVCHKDPSKTSNVDNHSGALTAYFTKPGKGYETTPALLHTSTPVHEMFAPSNLSYGRYWTYNYGISRYHHAIEVAQAPTKNTIHIRCMAGRGYISHKSWQFGDLRRAKDVIAQIKSTEDAHMESVHERLAVMPSAKKMKQLRTWDQGLQRDPGSLRPGAWKHRSRTKRNFFSYLETKRRVVISEQAGGILNSWLGCGGGASESTGLPSRTVAARMIWCVTSLTRRGLRQLQKPRHLCEDRLAKGDRGMSVSCKESFSRIE